MSADAKLRWQYRFDNYRRAFLLLREAVERMESASLTQLEKEGLIQRFEYTWELAWKVLKDYLEQQGVVLETVTPLAVVRAAFAARLIADGDGWIQALETRNRMAHTYDFAVFERAIESIRATYLPLFDALYLDLLAKSDDARG